MESIRVAIDRFFRFAAPAQRLCQIEIKVSHSILDYELEISMRS